MAQILILEHSKTYCKIRLDVEEYLSIYPTEYALYQNYPNPFNPTTTIRYAIPLLGEDERGGLVTLRVYDILGSEVAALVNEEKPAGSYELKWNAANLPKRSVFLQNTSRKFYRYEEDDPVEMKLRPHPRNKFGASSVSSPY